MAPVRLAARMFEVESSASATVARLKLVCDRVAWKNHAEDTSALDKSASVKSALWRFAPLNVTFMNLVRMKIALSWFRLSRF